MARVHLQITSTGRQKDLNTSISNKLQREYKKKCKELKLKYKFLKDAPNVYGGIRCSGEMSY